MGVFSDISFMEVIAASLAAVIMLGPLVPYAIRGRQHRKAKLSA